MSHASDNVVEDTWVEVGRHRWRKPKWLRRFRFPDTIQPQSKLYLIWLGFVAAAFIYNTTAIPLRAVFPYQRPEYLHIWLALDYFCDFLYLADMVFFKPRIRFNNHGVIETKRKLTRKHYLNKRNFKIDVLSLMPLDFLYFVVGINAWLRIPRLFKIHAFWEFFERCDQAVRSGFALRISKTVIYMLVLIHVEACGYYAASVYEGIGSNRWVYSGVGNAYIRCFYLAAKTATSIGNNPKPTNVFEYIFMTIYWLSGVFVFALLIGQIRDIVDSVGKIRNGHRKRVDDVLHYMKRIDLPKHLQERVRTWFNYSWEQQKALNEETVMDILPRAIKTDLSISVNFQTLNKVQIFQDCDKNLLFALVLKLKPVLYLPDDYICKKGEVGKEMYIVSQGVVDVLGGKDSKSILATLREGSVFGEISLLGLSSGGGNRRTADIRCRGYTNLFILSKSDFEQAMKDYPEAHKLLKHKAKKLLKMNAKFEDKQPEKECEEIIKTQSETPKLIKTAIKIMQVRSGSKYVPFFKTDKPSKDSEDSQPSVADPTEVMLPNTDQEPDEVLQITKEEHNFDQPVEEHNFDQPVEEHNLDQPVEEHNLDQEPEVVVEISKTEQEIEEDEILESAERYEQEKNTDEHQDTGVEKTLTAADAKEHKMSVTSEEINEIMQAVEMDENGLAVADDDVFRTDTYSVVDKQKYTTNQSVTSEEINDILLHEPIEMMDRKSVTSEEINEVFKSEPFLVQPVTPVIEHHTDVARSPGISIELIPHSKPSILSRNQFTLAAEIHNNHSKSDFWSDDKISYSKPTAKVLPLVKINSESPLKSDSEIITNSGDFQSVVSCEDLKSKETGV